jgi:hypothetical protein
MGTIITSAFEAKRGYYGDLYRVWEYSVRNHMPGAEIVCLNETPRLPKGRNDNYAALTARLNSWVGAAEKTKGNIIFMDVDMVVRADLFKAFDDFEFDIAYTGRRNRKHPLNGGILFVRDGAQDFIRKWASINNVFFRDLKLHKIWRKKCRGMNQPALWYLIKHPEKHGKKMLSLPCSIYNACEPEWAGMGDEAQVIHLKKIGRRVIDAGYKPKRAGAMRAVEIWREYEEAARCEKS